MAHNFHAKNIRLAFRVVQKVKIFPFMKSEGEFFFALKIFSQTVTIIAFHKKKEENMGVIIEIIIDGAKEFSVQIIAGIYFGHFRD